MSAIDAATSGELGISIVKNQGHLHRSSRVVTINIGGAPVTTGPAPPGVIDP